MTAVVAQGLSRSFNGTLAVDDLTVEIEEGELFALLGPSGCGKTTSLRMIAGFEPSDSGTLSLYGELVLGQGTFFPPERRGDGMVFQDYALFPHMTVAGNVEYGLSSGHDRQSQVAEALAVVGLDGFGDRSVHELSGGEQQRVALARAFINAPAILFVDEPTGNLDTETSATVEDLLFELNRETGTTLILVTHDLELAHRTQRVVRLRGGQIADDIRTLATG